MRAAGWRNGGGGSRAVLAALFSLLLASCTSTGDPELALASPGYGSPGPAIETVEADSGTVSTATAAAGGITEGDATLPDQVAYLPLAKPAAESAAAVADATEAAGDAATVDPAQAEQEQPTASIPEAAKAPEKVAGTLSTRAVADAKPAQQIVTAAPDPNQVYVTSAPFPETQPIAPKKKSFLSSFFGASPAAAAPAPFNAVKAKPVVAETKAKPVIAQDDEAEPLITLASAKPAGKQLALASLDDGDLNPLPGVRQTMLFEIKRKSGLDDDSDVDLHEEDDNPPILLASAAGMARLAPNGLLKQTESVDVACLKPSLVRVLKTVEQHYGKKMIVTSGYRSRARNVAARGAKNSLHMYCAAADVQIPGVSKWELANYVRSMAGRGGVGTYCHTESVHIDVGPERDWNWRCRRRG